MTKIKDITSTLYNSFLIIDDPHNVFFSQLAQAGILGFISYLLLILYFMKHDVTNFSKSNTFVRFTMISFWSVFLYSLLNPVTDSQYQFYFWLLRGMIHNKSLKTSSQKEQNPADYQF